MNLLGFSGSDDVGSTHKVHLPFDWKNLNPSTLILNGSMCCNRFRNFTAADSK